MRRDIGNEVVVAIAAVALLAFALTAAVLLSLSTSNQNSDGTATFVSSNVGSDTTVPENNNGTRSILEAVTEDAAKTLTQAFLQLTVLPSASHIVPTVSQIAETKVAPVQTSEATQIALVASPTREAVASPAERPTTRPTITEAPTITNTPTKEPTAVPTNTPTITPSVTKQPTATDTPTASPTFTYTPTERPSATYTSTATSTSTDTPVPTNTFTPTDSPTTTPSQTSTDTPTNTPSYTPSYTATPTNTATTTPSQTPTDTPTNTPSYTPTPTMDFGILPTPTVTQAVLVTITATEDLGILPTPSETLAETPVLTTSGTPGIVQTPTPVPARGDCILPEGWSVYTVQPDDMLFSIARTVGRSISELSRLNCLEDAAVIIAGELLFVPDLAPAPQQTVDPGVEAETPKSIGCADTNAQIVVPIAGDKVRGTFTLLGTASIPDFLYYRVEIRADDQFVYTLYGRYSVAVSRGNLALIDTTSLDAGSYWIRLSVVDVNGRIPQNAVCVVPIEIER